MKGNLNIKANKKTQYAIRMLNFHSHLAQRYYLVVREFCRKNNISHDENLYKYVERENKICDGQMSIFDFTVN